MEKRFTWSGAARKWVQDNGFLLYHQYGWYNPETREQATIQFTHQLKKPWRVRTYEAKHGPTALDSHVQRRIP